MSEPPPLEEAQLLARLTVLERVVGVMLRQSLLGSGDGPKDILAFGEAVKDHLQGRTPGGPTDRELKDAADRFFRRLLRTLVAKTASSRHFLPLAGLQEAGGAEEIGETVSRHPGLARRALRKRGGETQISTLAGVLCSVGSGSYQRQIL